LFAVVHGNFGDGDVGHFHLREAAIAAMHRFLARRGRAPTCAPRMGRLHDWFCVGRHTSWVACFSLSPQARDEAKEDRCNLGQRSSSAD
jgi:hypothetical protein